MPHLASYFPKIEYEFDGVDVTNRHLLTDLSLRFRIRDVVLGRVSSYFDYVVDDGELPWHIADRYYDDPTLDWVILMTNDIIDPYYDWPMSSAMLLRYVRDKYAAEKYVPETADSVKADRERRYEVGDRVWIDGSPPTHAITMRNRRYFSRVKAGTDPEGENPRNLTSVWHETFDFDEGPEGLHHLEWIAQVQRRLNDGTVIHEETYVVDRETHASLETASTRTVTNYTYEDRINEDKSRIRVLDRRFVPLILTEAERVLRTD